MHNTNDLPKDMAFDSTTFLAKVYGLMALSLALSFATSWITYSSGLLTKYANNASVMVGMIVAMILELILIWVISRQSVAHPQVAMVLLATFSVVDGATMSLIFYAYSIKLIMDAFMIATVDFASMSIIGLKTKKNLTWGRQLFGATIALLIVDIIQMFWFNSLTMVIFASIGVVIFSAWTIYDSQKIMQAGNVTNGSLGVVVSGALDMYLDFINLFLDILQIIGRFNNNN